MKSGGQKVQGIVFKDDTTHTIIGKERDELLQRAPQGTSKIVASDMPGEVGYGLRIKLEVRREQGPSLYCSVVGRGCIETLDKLRACLERLSADNKVKIETKKHQEPKQAEIELQQTIDPGKLRGVFNSWRMKPAKKKEPVK